MYAKKIVRLWCLLVSGVLLPGFYISGTFWSGSAVAEVYKWVDENGKTQFSDKAPAEKKAENIEEKLKKTNVDQASKTMKSGSVSGKEKTIDEKEMEEKKRKDLEKSIGKECRQMKQDIESIARGDRGAFFDENGNEEMVLERNRGAKLEEWKNNYQQYGCESLYPLE